MPGYSTERLAALFTIADESTEQRLDRLRHGQVWGYRTRTTWSGPLLEVQLYPLLLNREARREAKRHLSRVAQQNLNERNARLRFRRLLQANFDKGDLVMTLTYAGTYIPTEEEAHQHIAEYLRAIRKYRERRGMPGLKYLYVIEAGGQGGREKRVHHHVVMSRMDRDTAEQIWGRGRANSRTLQPDADGSLDGLAHYITKEKQQPRQPAEGRVTSRKRWQGSRNLRNPRERTADHKISKRRVQRVAEDCRVAAKEIFEKLYPDYAFSDCEVKTSVFVAGAYIYTTMYRRREHGD